MHNDLSGDQWAAVARALSIEQDAPATLEQATETAVTIVEGCDHAGITLVAKRGRVTTIAPTDKVAIRADELQDETNSGPCLQGLIDAETVYVSDVRTDERWPDWAAKVHGELSIRSVLSLQLFVGPDALGALNLYSDEPHAFAMDDRVSALALAAHVAVAVTAAQDYDGMQSALIHRTVIGQAQGMLIQAFKITPDQSFAALIRISQTKNLKLHVVARDIVDNGLRADLLS